ncbi:MAG: zinc dependent phospholipase C family protein [Anaerolineales bacterium]|nr:zinc dependent phospholipase C family protein [Anaerolineales bacterium]
MAYNRNVPTPFYHISVAYEIREHPALPVKIKEFLAENWNAFLFGKTAPDVQVVSHQSRQDTHFYTVPPVGTTPAWERMLSIYPALSHPGKLSPHQAAFIAGYACHLEADEAWLWDIFLPVFGPDAAWETFRQRLYLHNVMRAYLDRIVVANLPKGAGTHMQAAQPHTWLPFVEDTYLVQWRDLVAGQLQPGAKIQTVEVFAGRQGVDVNAFYQLLDSEERMDAEVFQHLPRPQLADYHSDLVLANITLLQTYLADL